MNNRDKPNNTDYNKEYKEKNQTSLILRMNTPKISLTPRRSNSQLTALLPYLVILL